MADGKRLTRRLVIDQGELDFLVRDTRQSGTMVETPQKCPLGHILTYYDGLQPQYTHLRIRKVLPGCLGWERFEEAWKPCDLILTSRLKVRHLAQNLLFERHEEYFRTPRCPPLPSGIHKAAEHHGHHPRVDGRDEACSIIGKFTQGSLAEKMAGKEPGHRSGGSSISWSVTHSRVEPWWEHPKSALWDIS